MTVEMRLAKAYMLGMARAPRLRAAAVLFGYGVAIFALRERPGRREQLGTGLLVVAILGLLWDRAA